MKNYPVDPRRLDVAAFAKAAAQLRGDWPLASLERLVDSAHPEVRLGEGDVAQWSIRGESRPVRGGAPQTWFHLRATARLALVCQRCLGPVDAIIDADRSFLFVADENAAAKLDADHEADVLVLTRSLDLRELVEDELLLALPLVPRHEVCPNPLPVPVPVDGPDEGEQRQTPFAALASLRRSGPRT